MTPEQKKLHDLFKLTDQQIVLIFMRGLLCGICLLFAISIFIELIIK